MLNVTTMSKRHLLIFIIIILIVSSGFAVLGVMVAGEYPFGFAVPVHKAVYQKKAVKPAAKQKNNRKQPDYIMVATAYSDRGETKSRIHAGLGSVAVDRTIIPHGTLLYIEGYGLALATDTGRLIKGYRVDVWFPDENIATEWGRKKVKVWKVGQADIKKILSTGGEYVKY